MKDRATHNLTNINDTIKTAYVPIETIMWQIFKEHFWGL